MNIPIALTTIRIILAPVFWWAIYSANWVLAFATLAVAVLTDIADGYIARRFKQETQLGKFLDPLADKLVFGGGFIVLILTYHLPLYYFLAIFRDVIIGLVGLYLFISRRKTKNVDFTSSFWGKATTVMQFIAMLGIVLYVMGFPIAVPLLDVLILLTFIVSFICSVHYLTKWMKKGYL